MADGGDIFARGEESEGEGEGIDGGFWKEGLQGEEEGAKQDGVKKRVRFNSDSDISVGWQAFGATESPPLLFPLLTRAMHGKKHRGQKRGGSNRGQPGEQITRVKCARALFSRVNVA